MKDARGRKVELGDRVCTPWPPLKEMSADLLTQLPQIISGAVLGRVQEIVENQADSFIHIGDDVTLAPNEFVTISGLAFVECVGCGLSWPVDPRSDKAEECPDCGALLSLT